MQSDWKLEPISPEIVRHIDRLTAYSAAFQPISWIWHSIPLRALAKWGSNPKQVAPQLNTCRGHFNKF